MKKIFWQMLAIIIFLVWTVVFVANNYIDVLEAKSLQERLSDNILFAIPYIFFGLLIFFPTKYGLYAIVCCYLGLIGIFLGGSIGALMMYCLGCGFVFRMGLLFKNKFVTVILCVIPIVGLVMQYRFGVVALVASLLDVLFVGAFMLLSYAILKETVMQSSNSFAKKSNQEKRDLSVLTAEELTIVFAVLENKTFSAIGRDIHKSESAIKQYMVSIYKKLAIESKKELLELQKNDLLIFPK